MSSFHSITQVLHLCTQTRSLRAIKTLHAHLLKAGLYFTCLDLQSKLILSYAKSVPNNLQTLTIFLTFMDTTNPIPFNALLSSFSRTNLPFHALHTLSYMHSKDIALDSYTLCTSLRVSDSVRCIVSGKKIHAHVLKLGFTANVYVGSSMIVLYSKSSLIDDASKVFDEIPVKNTVCANALLSGFGEAHMWAESLSLVRLMRNLRLQYDQLTLCTIVRISANLSAVELGKQAHGSSIRTVSNFEGDLFLQSSLIDMYGKCGFVEKARYVFDFMGVRRVENRVRDVVLWTSMIGAYSKNGRFEDVIGAFKEMLMEGVMPDGLVFLAVISACSYTGNVSLGLEYFHSMVHEFRLVRDPEHYSCVVDMLCRAGELEKAFQLANNMPFTGTVTLWGALLSASTNCGNVEMGVFSARKALQLDPQNVGIYVLLSNLYARVGMWDAIGELRDVMKKRGLVKDIGCSWIEVGS